MREEYFLATVTGKAAYGVFVKSEKWDKALCHIKKLQRKIDTYNVGDYMWVVENDNSKPGKISVDECSPHSQSKEEAFEDFSKGHAEGDIVQGIVDNIKPNLGVFISLTPTHISLFHVKEYTDQFNDSCIKTGQLVTVQIGKIDYSSRQISLCSARKKNKTVATEIEGVSPDNFLDQVDINSRACDNYRETTDDFKITDTEIRNKVAVSYKKAVENDMVMLINETFTFQLDGETKYGGAIAVGGRANSFDGRKWFVNFIGSSSKIPGNAISLFAYVDDWNELLTELEKYLLSGENWDYSGTGIKSDLYILKQYLNYTFYCASNKGLVSISPNRDLAVFNTGLVNNVYEAIYFCFVPSEEGAIKKWQYKGFCTYGTGPLGKLLNSKMAEPPEKVQYFSSINDMLFDTTKTLNWDKEHILIENIERLPIRFIEDQCDSNDLDNIRKYINDIKRGARTGYSKEYDKICQYIESNIRLKRKLINRLDDAVSLAVKRCEWNYKTAIPIFYHVTNGISLLLPLCLSDDEQAADVALVVEKQESGNYQGQTILTLQMAYLDARLICRPNSEWLNPDLLQREKE